MTDLSDAELLTEAVTALRAAVSHPGTTLIPGGTLARVLADYDDRGRQLGRIREVCDSMVTDLMGGRPATSNAELGVPAATTAELDELREIAAAARAWAGSLGSTTLTNRAAATGRLLRLAQQSLNTEAPNNTPAPPTAPRPAYGQHTAAGAVTPPRPTTPPPPPPAPRT